MSGFQAGTVSLDSVDASINSIGQAMPEHLARAQVLLASLDQRLRDAAHDTFAARAVVYGLLLADEEPVLSRQWQHLSDRSEEHTSELQSRGHLVCRLLLEKKKPH